jgi:hypothetical protein
MAIRIIVSIPALAGKGPEMAKIREPRAAEIRQSTAACSSLALSLQGTNQPSVNGTPAESSGFITVRRAWG